MDFEEVIAQPDHRGKIAKYLDRLPTHIPTFQGSVTEIPIKKDCNLDVQHDFQLAYLKSDTPLESIEIIYNHNRLCVIPLDVMPYIGNTYTFPYPFTFFADKLWKVYNVKTHPATAQTVLGIIEGKVQEDTMCILPRTQFGLDFNTYTRTIVKGTHELHFDTAWYVCVGFLIDVTPVQDIENITLRLDGREKELKLFLLNSSTLYASIDHNPFPFYDSHGIDFRNMPNLSRFGSVELCITSKQDHTIRIRPISANILKKQHGYAGVVYC